MDHTRHSGIFNVPTYFNVGLVGAGGIGAMTALVLAKMGVRQLTVWDDDTVSEENIPTQLHPVSDVGKLKITSLQETLEHFSDEIIVSGIPDRVGMGMSVSGYNLFISAVDSITARQEIWHAVSNSHHVMWYLDMRMASREYQHFLVDLYDARATANYDELLMGLDETAIAEVPCTEKATFFTASLAAGHAGNVLCNLLRNEATSHRLVHYIPQNVIQTFKA
jgi:hypothetical protein